MRGARLNRVEWLDALPPDQRRPDLAATVALPGPEWEKRGAKFRTMEDGEGEQVRSASGVCPTSVGDITFSVWDYGDEPLTYLLVAGELSERSAFAKLVAAQLRRATVLSPQDKVTLFADHGDEASSEPKTAVLFDDLLGEIRSERSTPRREPQDQVLRRQRREFVDTLARDVVLLPISVLAVLALSLTSLFGNWDLPLSTSVIAIVVSIIVAIPLVGSIVVLLRFSFIRRVIATTPVPRLRRDAHARDFGD